MLSENPALPAIQGVSRPMIASEAYLALSGCRHSCGFFVSGCCSRATSSLEALYTEVGKLEAETLASDVHISCKNRMKNFFKSCFHSMS